MLIGPAINKHGNTDHFLYIERIMYAYYLMYRTNKLVTRIKALQRLGSTLHMSPKTLQQRLFSAPPNPLVYGATRSMKLPQPQFPIVQQRVLHNEPVQGVTRVVANITRRRRGIKREVCCGTSPWRDSTPFPPKTWMSAVFVL